MNSLFKNIIFFMYTNNLESKGETLYYIKQLWSTLNMYHMVCGQLTWLNTLSKPTTYRIYIVDNAEHLL